MSHLVLDADNEKTVLKGGKVRKTSKKIDRKLKYC